MGGLGVVGANAGLSHTCGLEMQFFLTCFLGWKHYSAGLKRIWLLPLVSALCSDDASSMVHVVNRIFVSKMKH